jgi:hypothetical protein
MLNALPPIIDQGGEGRQLATDFFERVVPRWQLLALREGSDGVDCGVQPPMPLGSSLGGGVVEHARMQGQRAGVQVMPIRAVDVFPPLHLHPARLDCRSELAAGRRLWRLCQMACQSVRGCLQLRMGVVHTLRNGERVALHQIMHARKEIRYAQTLEPLFRKLDQGFGPVAGQGSETSAKHLESRIH